jgi:hypothetical protein
VFRSYDPISGCTPFVFTRLYHLGVPSNCAQVVTQLGRLAVEFPDQITLEDGPRCCLFTQVQKCSKEVSRRDERVMILRTQHPAAKIKRALEKRRS